MLTVYIIRYYIFYMISFNIRCSEFSQLLRNNDSRLFFDVTMFLKIKGLEHAVYETILCVKNLKNDMENVIKHW